MKVIAVLETMWDWRAMTSGAGYREEAPRYFVINEQNFTGRRLYKLIGPDAELLVTNACPELVSNAKEHGTPDPRWLLENLKMLEPFDVLLICGNVAKATYPRTGYCTNARVIEMPHPAARAYWTKATIQETAARIQAACVVTGEIRQ